MSWLFDKIGIAPAKVSRRRLLKVAGAMATTTAAKVVFPAGAFAQGPGPDVKGT